MNNKATFAVTGAAGFVGGRMVKHLVSAGHTVIAVVRNDDQQHTLSAAGATARIADVRDRSALERAFEGVDGVFHCAALFNHPDRTWDDYRAVNVGGVHNVLDAAQHTGVTRVVHCSTVGVATEAHAPPYSEQTPYSPQPDDKYEITKCEGEQVARQYGAEHDLSVVIIRPAQVYGPGNSSKVKFYKMVKKGVIVAPGRTQKHMIYIDDLCEAMRLAMITPTADGEVFLIAGEKPTELTRLIQIAAETLQVPYPRLALPAWPVTFACATIEKVCNMVGVKPIVFKRSMDFFTRTVTCDTTKANQHLGFTPTVDVDEGVRKTVDWYKRNGLL